MLARRNQMDNLEILAGAVERLESVLERIANAQEQMVGIAMEAREERLKLSAQMKERLKAGFAEAK
jgi:hypothetical protein